MTTTGDAKSYMPQLDGLRAVAVSMVMFGHWIGIKALEGVSHVFRTLGVNLFFVLSGFLISGILLANKQGNTATNWHILRQFYIRRSLRIFPVYYLVVGVALLLNFPDGRENATWLLTYTTNWRMGLINHEVASFSHLWTLAVEEQFYVFFPFLLLLIPDRLIARFFIALIFLGIFSRLAMVWGGFTGWGVYTYTPCCLDSFGLGAVLAYFKATKTSETLAFFRKRSLYIIPVACMVIAVVLTLKREDVRYTDAEMVLFRMLMSIACVWVIGIAAFSDFKGAVAAFLNNAAVQYLGKISYGVYIYHHFLTNYDLTFPITANAHVNYLISRVLYFAITMTLAILSWHFFEKPLNGLKRRFEYRRH